MPTRALCIGQIIDDSCFDICNVAEAISLMLQFVLAVSALPRLREQPA